MRTRCRLVQVTENNRYWYGGAQEWCTQKYMRQYGCGVISCANAILHLQATDKIASNPQTSKFQIPKKTYMELVEQLRKRYLPVLPVLGMNGLVMTFGLNRYLRKMRLPYRAHWGCMPWNIWKRTQTMLENGIPVILSIGPNFPKLLGKQRLALYENDGALYRSKIATKAHYVTITEIDDEWITISSWGKKYYIKKAEYDSYVKHYSNYLFSNILLLTAKENH